MLDGRSKIPRYMILALKAAIPATTAPTKPMLNAGAVALRSILFPTETLTLQKHRDAAEAAYLAMIARDRRSMSIR
jgi:hypothetical protein